MSRSLTVKSSSPSYQRTNPSLPPSTISIAIQMFNCVISQCCKHTGNIRCTYTLVGVTKLQIDKANARFMETYTIHKTDESQGY